MNYTVTNVTCTTAGNVLVGRNNNRKSLILENKDASLVFIFHEVDVLNSLSLGVGERIEFNNPPVNALAGITIAGTASVAIWEA